MKIQIVGNPNKYKLASKNGLGDIQVSTENSFFTLAIGFNVAF